MPLLIPVASAPINSPLHSAPSVIPPEMPSIIGNAEVTPNKYPTVSLDFDAISDDIAARLAISLLGHVLFLKGQIPMPVSQLTRMPSAKSSPRVLKQRNELLSSYDTLMSHFNTTFTSLSSAMAKIVLLRATTAPPEANYMQIPDSCRAYVAILVGSSVSSASSKVFFAIDGLKIKAIGMRDDVPQSRHVSRGARSREGGEGENDDESEDEEEDQDEEEAGDEEDDDGGSSNDSYEEDDEFNEEGSDDEGQTNGEETINSPPESPPPSPLPISHPTYADQQKTLQAAERLLSKTLLLADAEGNGLSSDMTPTQTHILLRAPRRFSHPAWIPRQNISASLETSLDGFLAESGIKIAAENQDARRKQNKKSAAVWGVWVASKNGLDLTSEGKDGMGTARDSNDEWDEMIWWSWDGKLVGFSDW